MSAIKDEAFTQEPAIDGDGCKAKVKSFTAGLSALMEAAETESMRGCGLSDVLYESRVQEAYADILASAPDAEKSSVEVTLRERGYDPDYAPYEADEGECDLTGIDINCCPCGRHP